MQVLGKMLRKYYFKYFKKIIISENKRVENFFFLFFSFFIFAILFLFDENEGNNGSY